MSEEKMPPSCYVREVLRLDALLTAANARVAELEQERLSIWENNHRLRSGLEVLATSAARQIGVPYEECMDGPIGYARKLLSQPETPPPA